MFAANLARALRTLDARGARTLGRDLGQVLIVGGPAGDDELLGVLLRTLPEGVTAGRGNVGGTLAGPSAGHRHAAALGLALAPAGSYAKARAKSSREPGSGALHPRARVLLASWWTAAADAHSPRPPSRSWAPAYQPTATTRYCGLVIEMSEDCPASSSYGKPYCSPLMAFWCQNWA